MADFDTFTPDNDPYGIFTQYSGSNEPDTNTTLPDYTDDVAPGTISTAGRPDWTPPTGLPPSNTPTGIDNEGGDLTGGIGGWWNGLTTAVKNTFLKKDANGNPIAGQYDIGKILTAGGGALGGLAGLMGANKPTTTPSGYQGGIPQLTAVRTALEQPARTPYTGQPAMGRRYFTDTQYTNPANLAATQAASNTQAQQQQVQIEAQKRAQQQADTISQQQAARDQELARRKAQSVDTRPIYPGPDKTGLTGGPAMPAGGWRGSDIPYRQAAPIGEPEQAPIPTQPVQAAQGGLMAAHGTYLRGSTDGMADKLDTSIEGKQPAKLSHGEFVVPADVVSHLGNGNSDAGAKKLYQMMDRIRVARTGTKQQGKEINPDKFMPGGKVGYAEGGIATFADGGLASNVPSGTALAGGLTGSESNLSNWAGPYVTNMLGQGQAIANQPYQAYTGQLTAGTSPLQQQAFNQAANLQVPSSIGQAAQTAQNISQQAQNLGYSPATFGNQFAAPSAYQAGTFDTDMFGTQQAQQYMNPYLQQALDPQLAEARRQSQITQAQNAGKLTGAGAYGGGRQAIMDAETQRNLGTNLANITGQGYATAFDKAQAAFNADQARRLQAQQLGEQSRQFGAGQAMTGAQLGAQYGLAGQQATEASRQFGANYGLQGLNTALQGAQTQGQLGTAQNQAGLANLSALSGLGTTQRGIESEAVAADKAQFEEERLNPYKMVQFQQSLLQGLPLAAQTYNVSQPSWLQSLAQGSVFGANSLDTILKTLGLSSGQTGTQSAGKT
jgi:hypothetical protein